MVPFTADSGGHCCCRERHNVTIGLRAAVSSFRANVDEPTRTMDTAAHIHCPELHLLENVVVSLFCCPVFALEVSELCGHVCAFAIDSDDLINQVKPGAA